MNWGSHCVLEAGLAPACERILDAVINLAMGPWNALHLLESNGPSQRLSGAHAYGETKPLLADEYAAATAFNTHVQTAD